MEEKISVDKNANSKEMIANRDSIKTRLRRYFLGITLAIISVMSVFSMVYFYFATKNDAVTMIRNKLVLSQVFMATQKDSVKSFAGNLANNHAVQLGLQLKSPTRIQEYISKNTVVDRKYSVAVYGDDGMPIVEPGKLSTSEQMLLNSALGGNPVVSTAVSFYDNVQSTSYVCAYPVMYSKNIIGVILVRFIFKENLNFFITLSKNLECDLMVYLDSTPVVATANHSVSKDLYSRAAFSESSYEEISLASKGLNEYMGLKSQDGTSCGLLHLYVSSISYIRIFLMAIVIYVITAIILMIFAILLVMKISNSILQPINTLLEGVNIVRQGNLKHEIELKVHDEIGRLGTAFNEMREELDDKISTITDMNDSLEEKISERTSTINKLNENMKHYLSPQLYASIAGGERDVSTSRHYRKKLTVFFSDVVNFTATTDALEPEDLSNLLNSYLDNMARIAEKYKGTIDKYVGDAVMVFFGDPEFTSDKDHALRAVNMAIEMQEYLVTFRREWQSKGIANPFHVRMGINTGYCTIGNFGSEMKMDYTIIGNNVNMAARFEAAAKPDTILMSPDTYALIADKIECVKAGTYSLKGIPHPIDAYSPVGVKTEKGTTFAVMDGSEIVFPSRNIELSNIDKKKRRELLVSIKEIFDKVKGIQVKEASAEPAPDTSTPISMDEPEKAKLISESKNDV